MDDGDSAYSEKRLEHITDDVGGCDGPLPLTASSNAPGIVMSRIVTN